MTEAEPLPVAVDTSVIVAGLLGWHRDHERALVLLESALASGRLLLPSRVLIESYSVLTRMPAPHRLSPRVAMELLSETLRDAAEVIELPASGRWPFLDDLVEDEVAGGAAYDAEIVATATRAGARRLVTLNVRDYERLAPSDLEIVSGQDPPASQELPSPSEP
jgi:predicted nucleic acid-binding protein